VTLDRGSIVIRPLAGDDNRASFVCGKEPLDRYFREQATQDVRRGIASVFVAVAPPEPARVLGFFTLSAATVAPIDLPSEVARRLPRHPVPAALIGRLAVDRSFARRGLGDIMLADAIAKARMASETIAIAVIVVDPIDEAARDFYLAFGFRSLNGPQRRLFLVPPRRQPA